MSEEPKREGWTYLFNSRVEHYFVDGKSLCGKWGVFGYGTCDEKPTVNPPCATCMKKLQKRKQKENCK